VMLATQKKAEEILKNNGVRLISSNPPSFFHFHVNNSSGEWIDVWKTKGLWKCNSLRTEVRKGKVRKWGCVMNVMVDNTSAYCSHTRAAELMLNRLEERL
jgi:hypothetical protein